MVLERRGVYDRIAITWFSRSYCFGLIGDRCFPVSVFLVFFFSLILSATQQKKIKKDEIEWKIKLLKEEVPGENFIYFLDISANSN